jgi:hypothetical protein
LSLYAPAGCSASLLPSTPVASVIGDTNGIAIRIDTALPLSLCGRYQRIALTAAAQRAFMTVSLLLVTLTS